MSHGAAWGMCKKGVREAVKRLKDFRLGFKVESISTEDKRIPVCLKKRKHKCKPEAK